MVETLTLFRDLSCAEQSANGEKARSLVAQIERKQKINAERPEVNHYASKATLADVLYGLRGAERYPAKHPVLRDVVRKIASTDMRAGASSRGAFAQFCAGMKRALTTRTAFKMILAEVVGLGLFWVGHPLVGAVVICVAGYSLVLRGLRLAWRERRKQRRAAYFERVAALEAWHARHTAAVMAGCDPAEAVARADMSGAERAQARLDAAADRLVEQRSKNGHPWRGTGTFAARPVATSCPESVYYAEDVDRVYLSDGVMWTEFAKEAGRELWVR